MSVIDLLGGYLRSRLQIRPGTRIQYEIAIRHWTAFSDRAADLIDRDDLTRFAEWLLVGGRTPATVNKVLRHLLAVLNHQGLSPAWTPLREPWRAPVAFLAEEFRAVLDVASLESGDVAGLPAADWWRSFLLGIWYSGARVGAVLQVTIPDVLIDRQAFFVRHQHQKQHADQFFHYGEDADKAFRRIWNPDRRLMWPWPWRRELLYRRFGQICRSAGFESRQNLFHRIRKSTASYMRKNGGDATAHLGHSSPSVTKRYFDPRIVSGCDATAFLPSL